MVAISIGCAIYFSFPGWGDLQAAVDRVIAPARRFCVRARAPPESIGGREEVSLSASTIHAARVPNPATACVDRSDGHPVVVAAQGCVAPVLHSYLQTDYAIFKVQSYAIAAHKSCVWQKVARSGLFQGFARRQSEGVKLRDNAVHQLGFNLLLDFVIDICMDYPILKLCGAFGKV